MRLEQPVNLHGLKLPFHVHRRLGPGLEVRNFANAADVAVVHLNPDAWHLMTGDQRREMARARLKVGLWVWEMDRVPDFFYPNLLKVDAVWSPSRYCADIFARASGRPTFVVPHVVPVPPRPEPRSQLTRTILYVFDGSSYLARKNPMALLEAFDRSGLAGRGWRLVLKTKNLFENPGAGRALAERAATTPNVQVIDAPVSRAQMAALFDGADIYASPHASEGFGLTIAEAMAAGKLVVATDYSGSRDFLDGGCGFPVAYDLVSEDGDHGHYRQGGRWAKVRVDALTQALVEAADRLEQGDHSLGEQARARIAERLSPDAVAAAMHQAFARLAELTPLPLDGAA
jgi:glycosyltransferase involved in cell wall biosynthesis